RDGSLIDLKFASQRCNAQGERNSENHRVCALLGAEKRAGVVIILILNIKIVATRREGDAIQNQLTRVSIESESSSRCQALEINRLKISRSCCDCRSIGICSYGCFRPGRNAEQQKHEAKPQCRDRENRA